MAAEVDELTGLLSRMAFERTLKQTIATAGEGVALAMVDLDNFKELNDELGFETGDQVLRSLAGLLREVAPERAFRLGGDEFALVMPDTTLEQAFLRLEGLRARVPEVVRVTLNGGVQPMTIKAGVAQIPRDAKDYRGLIGAVDAALQTAREIGRNTVCLPPNEEMVMKSCYYPKTSLSRLEALAKRLNRSQSRLLREALADLLRKYDAPGDVGSGG